MEKLTFDVPKMDCGAEEQLVQMSLADRVGVVRVSCDLNARQVHVVHDGDSWEIELAMADLKLGASLVGSSAASELEVDATDDVQRRTLVAVLAINAALFVVEMAIGLVAGSMGLVADSLDMLADATVYGISLAAVGRSGRFKKNVAALSGASQLLLATLGIFEVTRRFFVGEAEPISTLMIGTSILALCGNVASLILLQRSRSREVHIRATSICTSNDVLVNLGVIAAGVLVYATSSRLPDLLIGAIVFLVVAYGGARILRIAI